MTRDHGLFRRRADPSPMSYRVRWNFDDFLFLSELRGNQNGLCPPFPWVLHVDTFDIETSSSPETPRLASLRHSRPATKASTGLLGLFPSPAFNYFHRVYHFQRLTTSTLSCPRPSQEDHAESTRIVQIVCEYLDHITALGSPAEIEMSANAALVPYRPGTHGEDRLEGGLGERSDQNGAFTGRSKR